MNTAQPATKQDVENIVKTAFNEFGQVFSDALQMISDRFNRVDDRFKLVDDRFDRVDERFDQVDKRFGELETVIMRMDNKLNDALDRLDDHDAKIRMIQRKIA